MADKIAVVKKSQIGIDEYLKIKENRAKSKLKIYLPLLVQLMVAVPAGYFIFLIIYFLIYLRFLPEH